MQRVRLRTSSVYACAVSENKQHRNFLLQIVVVKVMMMMTIIITIIIIISLFSCNHTDLTMLKMF